ncbi:MAG: transglutaminase-like domain-containing protein [Planctomycetota bacterium]
MPLDPHRTRHLAHGTRRKARALVALLPEGRPEVQRALEGLGKAALPALRAAAAGSEPLLRVRARGAMLARQRRRAAARVAGYGLGLAPLAPDPVALERGLWLVDRFLDPDLDVRASRASLDVWGRELRARIALRPPGARRALQLVELLAGEIGFDGARSEPHHPHGASLARTIERRMGLPLTLCVVYASVGQRAGLDAQLLPFPGHVLLELRDGGDRLIVDAFDKGRLLTERHCLAHLARHGVPYRERWFTPASARDMLQRQLHNLAHSLVQRGLQGEQSLLAAISAALSGPRDR